MHKKKKQTSKERTHCTRLESQAFQRAVKLQVVPLTKVFCKAGAQCNIFFFLLLFLVSPPPPKRGTSSINFVFFVLFDFIPSYRSVLEVPAALKVVNRTPHSYTFRFSPIDGCGSGQDTLLHLTMTGGDGDPHSHDNQNRSVASRLSAPNTHHVDGLLPCTTYLVTVVKSLYLPLNVSTPGKYWVRGQKTMRATVSDFLSRRKSERTRFCRIGV